MHLSFKPDLDQALERWRAFWNQEIIKRPCVAVTAPKEGVPVRHMPAGQIPPETDFDRHLDQVEEAMACRVYRGEAIPYFQPSFGPDQVAAFVGARLDWSKNSAETSWSVPFVESWKDVLPLKLGVGNDSWSRMIELCQKAGARGEGKFLVGMLDLHSNLDWLAAIRGPDRLCMDLLDVPDLIQQAMRNVRQLYHETYEALYTAGNMQGRGTCGWLPYYCEGRFATTQCDFSCLLSPAQFREFVLEALAEECESLDHSVYHYDGATCLQHFDAITGISRLDSIQWTPTAGGPPMMDWLDLLKRFQSTGKSVFVPCSADELKVYHRELEPNLVFYSVGVGSEQEADELLQWLERNT